MIRFAMTLLGGAAVSLFFTACAPQTETSEHAIQTVASFTPMKAQVAPEILYGTDLYLPDFSYAGFRNGNPDLPAPTGKIFDVAEFGAIADDGLDDTKAVLAAREAAHAHDGPVILKFPKGRFILSDILYIERSDFSMVGEGDATTLYYPRPMRFLPTPQAFQELDEYLLEFEKRQRESKNNVDLPFSLYAWSGGYIWTQAPGARGKAYLEKYDNFLEPLTGLTQGEREGLNITVKDASDISVGDVFKIEWYNRLGENGPLLDAMYGDRTRFKKLGGHHWNFPRRALVTQMVRITEKDGNRLTLSAPLMFNAEPEYEPSLVPWDHLENVHIMDFNVEFPNGIRMPHHVEDGFNAIYLMSLFDSSVRNVKITNADSGIITDDNANVTIRDITTKGDHRAHYTVHMGSVYNILVEGLRIENTAEHPISFNTYAVRSVYRDSDVLENGLLDQHSGANHQNLFDDIRVRLKLEQEQDRIKLFDGGGAGYWKPSHGRYSTFHNIQVEIDGAENVDGPITLTGPQDGVEARILHVYGNREFDISYAPDPHIEGTNIRPVFTSLYDWQRERRNAN